MSQIADGHVVYAVNGFQSLGRGNRVQSDQELKFLPSGSPSHDLLRFRVIRRCKVDLRRFLDQTIVRVGDEVAHGSIREDPCHWYCLLTLSILLDVLSLFTMRISSPDIIHDSTRDAWKSPRIPRLTSGVGLYRPTSSRAQRYSVGRPTRPWPNLCDGIESLTG